MTVYNTLVKAVIEDWPLRKFGDALTNGWWGGENLKNKLEYNIEYLRDQPLFYEIKEIKEFLELAEKHSENYNNLEELKDKYRLLLEFNPKFYGMSLLEYLAYNGVRKTYKKVMKSRYLAHKRKVGMPPYMTRREDNMLNKLITREGRRELNKCIGEFRVENRVVKQYLYGNLKKRIAVANKSLVPSHMKEVTYKGFVEEYFKGFKFDDSTHAPKLSKQLTKQKIKFTNEEITAISEFKSWYMLATIGNHRPIFVDTKDFSIPGNVDGWAFQDSCNNSSSGAGSHTHLFLDTLGCKYLKFWELTNKNTMTPKARTYFFLSDDNDLAHAGTYLQSNSYLTSDLVDRTAYKATTFILCVLFNKRVEDFSRIKGIDIDNDSYGYDEVVNIWTNMSDYCDYSKYGTSELLNSISKEEINDAISYLNTYYSSYDDLPQREGSDYIILN